MCCFDKTGTLTKDEFIMRGVATPTYDRPQTPGECDENTLSILLGCHSLLWVNQKLVGDPIELIVFKNAGGTISNNWISSSRKVKMFPIKKYTFDSVLKRMSVLVTFYSGQNPNEKVNRILTKGAPETMKEFFKSLPENYDECYNKYAKLGFRILAIGYKDSNDMNANTKRDEAECDLTFCGFIIVETPLKHDTEKYMKELKASGFDMCIITGDHHLTTAKVSQDCALGPHDILFLRVLAKKGEENLVETTKEISNISFNYFNRA
jgi:cation-transporting ATPase 13A1